MSSRPTSLRCVTEWKTDSKSISRYILIRKVPNSVMEESRQEHTTYMTDSKLLPTKEKWGGNMTIIEYEAETVRKDDRKTYT